MTELYLPASALREQRLQNEAEATRFMAARMAPWWHQFDRDLQRIDPSLSLVFCPEPAPLNVVAAGARPGRYNIMRQSHKGGPMTFMPVVGPDGEFVEPTSRVFDQLKSMDWWDPEVMRERKRVQDQLEDERRKRHDEEMRRIQEETWERWLAVSRTQISMNRETAWGQNARGAALSRGERRRRQKGKS